MGVLMRGVDMPKNCEECNFKGECRDYWEKIREAYTRPSWCPLVEVADRKTEPLDKDINVRSKTMRDCYNCKRYEAEGECIECHFEPKTEPQYHADVECNYKDCDNCGHKEYCPQSKTEPKTDCSWK